MIEIRNTLFQPLTFHLAKGSEAGPAGLHLGPRERRKIRPDQLSPEIEKAAKRGLVALVHRPDETPTHPPEVEANRAEPSDVEPAANDPVDAQSTTTHRKRR